MKLTIVVPTYNRPDSLGRLLTLLRSGAGDTPILVLDSSSDRSRERNQAVAEARAGDGYRAYPVAMPPFDKFAAGLSTVDTDLAVLVADDDVLLPDSIEPLIAHMRANDCVAAHGWYFGFTQRGSELRVTDLLHTGGGLTKPRAIHRLCDLITGYEALTYAVFRTPVARDAFSAAAGQDSAAARELVGGALAAIAGKVARLPLLSHGRAESSSHGYRNWHPLEWLMLDPQAAFASYAHYRERLMTAFAARPASDGGGTPEATRRLIDLAHLAYVRRYLHPAVIELALRRDPARLGEARFLDEIWNRWHALHSPPAVRMLKRSPAPRRMARRLWPGLSLRHTLRRWRPGTGDMVIPSARGGSRIRIYSTVLRQIEPIGGRATANELAAALAAY